MKNLFLTGIAVAVVAVLLSGCDDLLQVEPRQSVDPETAQENIDGIEAIMTSVYNRVQSRWRYGRELILAPEALADNTDHHPITSGRHQGHFQNQRNSHISGWNTHYLTINEANYVIDGVEVVEAPTDVRERLRGEALFQRAFAYFDLARTYGYEPGREVGGWDQSVIIRTEPTRDVTDADLRARSTNQEVYDLIVSDLEEAATLLEGNDRGVYFANHEAALSLLARAHLYLENWQDAIEAATAAINATSVDLVDEETFSENIFETEPNPESILELSIDPAAESLGSNHAPNQILTPVGWFDVLVHQELLDLYEEDDVRLSTLYEQDEEGYDYIVKYTASVAASTDHHPLIRFPELLLIRAEAHAELGQNQDALDNLNQLREARGASTFESDDSEELIMEVLDERRRELAFEGGHRWFDLKRRGMDVEKEQHTVSYDDYRMLAPLPTTEVDNNPELEQNPEY